MLNIMKKYNYLYIVGVPLFCILLCIIGTSSKNLGLDISNQLSANLFLIGIVLIFSFIFSISIFFKITCKKMDKQLENMNIDQIFYGNGSKIAIDQTNNKIVLNFKCNPFKIYVMSLTKVVKAKTNDYKSGKGIFEGTMRVAFEFWIDEQKITINTFRSQGQKFKMDSSEVLTGISKADDMVEILTNHLGK